MLHGIRLAFRFVSKLQAVYCHYHIPRIHHVYTCGSFCCHYLTQCIFRLKCAAAACFSFFLAILNISFANRNILLACRYIIFNRFIHLDFGFQIHFEFEIFCILKKEQKIKRKNNNSEMKWKNKKTTATTTYKHSVRYGTAKMWIVNQPSKCFYNKQNKRTGQQRKNRVKKKSKIHCTSTESENQ